MLCKDVELALEQHGLDPLPERAREHLAACDACQNLLSDVSCIVSLAHGLPAEVAPPGRLWVSLRNQLEAEGIIHEPVVVAAGSSLWHRFAELLGGRAMATSTVGLLLVGAAILLSTQKPPQPPPARHFPSFADTARVLQEQEQDLANMQLASTDPIDTSLHQNLTTVDEFIANCEQHMKENPQDDLTRDYLANAYQQKAELLSAMMDRGRSLN